MNSSLHPFRFPAVCFLLLTGLLSCSKASVSNSIEESPKPAPEARQSTAAAVQTIFIYAFDPLGG